MKYGSSNFERSRVINEDLNIGKIGYGYITAVIITQGAVSCDVIDRNGNLHQRCPILGFGADEFNWSMPPVYVNMQVVFLTTGYNKGAPIILGSLFRPRNVSNDKLGFDEEDTTTAKTADHLNMSVQDYIAHVGTVNDETYLQMTSKNGVVLETDKNVRIQLPDDGILRISSNRQIVDEPLNGQQFINVVTPFFQSLASINQSQGDVLTIFNTALNALNDTLKLKIAPLPPGLNQGALPVTNAELAGYIATLSAALSGAVGDLAATNFEYETAEYQHPTDELKPKMEATINRKVKLPK